FQPCAELDLRAAASSRSVPAGIKTVSPESRSSKRTSSKTAVAALHTSIAPNAVIDGPDVLSEGRADAHPTRTLLGCGLIARSRAIAGPAEDTTNGRLLALRRRRITIDP